MQELQGSLFNPCTYVPNIGTPNAVCITTNGDVTSSGRAVMGRGCALEAKQRFPYLDLVLGQHLQHNGNTAAILLHNKKRGLYIISFPVKPGSTCVSSETELEAVLPRFRSTYPRVYFGWQMKASLSLIQHSAAQLVQLVDKCGNISSVVIPRPGCGNGGLIWKDVEKVLAPILDDRFYIIKGSR